MSTKIYHAWRMRPERYPLFVDRLAGYAYARAAEHFKAVMAPRRRDIPTAVQRLYYASHLLTWEIGSVDCRVEAAFFGRLVYAVPFSDLGLFGFEPGLPFQEFWYWNNTDKPEEIPRREWTARRRVWNRVLAHWGSAGVTDVLVCKNIEHVEKLVQLAYPKVKLGELMSYYDLRRATMRFVDKYILANEKKGEAARARPRKLRGRCARPTG